MFLRRLEKSNRPFRGRCQHLLMETLESRRMLSNVPFGAAHDDTAEFLLGSVTVSVVLFESDGTLDENLEDWTPSQVEEVKQTTLDGLSWWTERLAEQNSVHSLSFKIDDTYALAPIQTGYEPISRRSNDFGFYVEDFFEEVNLPHGGFSERIRAFNHQQRLKHDTNWAFTIFFVNAEADVDDRFDLSGDFSLAFAFAGGRSIVATSERPASTIAHETAHMFWAMDEYAGSKSYTDRRGYYNTQNLNAADDHPNPAERVRSILDRQGTGYLEGAVSPSGLEAIGWKDSDGDGIFDVLDVPLTLDGVGEFDVAANSYSFIGNAAVNTAPNRNSSGNGNDITLNKISRIEYRFDSGPWQTAATYDAYEVDVELQLNVPLNTSLIELRAVDGASGVKSATQRDAIDQAPLSWQNVTNPHDVNGDGAISPIDVLMVINELNSTGSRELPETRPTAGPPFIDVSGDRFVSPLDALSIINELNRRTVAAVPAAFEFDDSAANESHPGRLPVVAGTEFAAEGEIAARIVNDELDRDFVGVAEGLSRLELKSQELREHRERFDASRRIQREYDSLSPTCGSHRESSSRTYASMKMTSDNDPNRSERKCLNAEWVDAAFGSWLHVNEA